MPPRRTPARRTRTQRVLKADVGRFDGELKTVGFSDGDSVNVLLDKANLSVGSGQEINDSNGNTVSGSDKAKNGETYYITGNYKNGKTA